MKRALAPLGGPELRLRLAGRPDLPAMLEWRNRDDARVWFKTSSVIAMDGHRAWFDDYERRDDDFLFIVESHDRPVGQVSLYGIDWAARSAEFGRFLAAPGDRGKGLMSAACGLLLDFCAVGLGLRHIRLEVLAGNQRAIALYRRHGFVADGTEGPVLGMTLDLGSGTSRAAWGCRR